MMRVGWQRTLIDPPVLSLGGCWRCGLRGEVVAGYYVGGSLPGRAPWRPVCAECDAAILGNPDGDAFAAGLNYWSPARGRIMATVQGEGETADTADPGAAR